MFTQKSVYYTIASESSIGTHHTSLRSWQTREVKRRTGEKSKNSKGVSSDLLGLNLMISQSRLLFNLGLKKG